jgi:hypothetical protein
LLDAEQTPCRATDVDNERTIQPHFLTLVLYNHGLTISFVTGMVHPESSKCAIVSPLVVVAWLRMWRPTEVAVGMLV